MRSPRQSMFLVSHSVADVVSCLCRHLKAQLGQMLTMGHSQGWQLVPVVSWNSAQLSRQYLVVPGTGFLQRARCEAHGIFQILVFNVCVMCLCVYHMCTDTHEARRGCQSWSYRVVSHPMWELNSGPLKEDHTMEARTTFHKLPSDLHTCALILTCPSILNK